MKEFESSQNAWDGLMESFEEQVSQTTEMGPYVVELADEDIRQLNESYRDHLEAFDEDLLFGEEEDVTLQAISELLDRDFDQLGVLKRGDIVCIAGGALVLSVNLTNSEVSACPVARGGRVVGRLTGVLIGESPLEEHLATLLDSDDDDEAGDDQAYGDDVPHEVSPILVLEDAHYEEVDDDRGSGVYRDDTFPEGDVIFVPTHYSSLVVAKVVGENSRTQ